MRNTGSRIIQICSFGLILLITWPSAAEPAPESGDPELLVGALRPRAIEQLLASACSKDPFLRANALEAAVSLPDRVVSLVQLGLEDEHAVVRFAALATCGKLQLSEMQTALRRLQNDADASVRAAAMFALRRCGLTVDITPLARMLVSRDPQLRSNVAMLLGLMGDPSAVPMLKNLAKVPLPRASAVRTALVRLQIAESILKLGDDSVLDAVRAGSYSAYDEVRVLAVQIMGETGDHRMEQAIQEMLQTPPIQIQIAAAASLGQLGRPDGLEILFQAMESPIMTVRAQAALTLEWFWHQPAAVHALTKLLEDSQEQVRLAAAAAVVRARIDAVR